jgi:hypothetical protein
MKKCSRRFILNVLLSIGRSNKYIQERSGHNGIKQPKSKPMLVRKPAAK